MNANVDVLYEIMTFAPVFAAFAVVGGISTVIVGVARMFPHLRRWIDEDY